MARNVKEWPTGRRWLTDQLEQARRERSADWLVFWGVVGMAVLWWALS
jgi:hypothetical protein